MVELIQAKVSGRDTYTADSAELTQSQLNTNKPIKSCKNFFPTFDKMNDSVGLVFDSDFLGHSFCKEMI